ncbi:hypothetical protein AVEN_173628-1, partial [Araneus ventricosus]
MKQYLVEEFLEQIIGYGGFQEWPPDLTLVDLFLWGYLKQQVYATPEPSTTHYGCLCQRDTRYATSCAT